jgi:uncharacterized protein (TIGR02246 family)
MTLFRMFGAASLVLWSTALFCGALFCGVSAAQAQAGKEESAVRALAARYMDARDKQDAHAIEALFTPDADQLVSSGEWRKGRPEIVKGTMASSQSNRGARTIAVESVRFLAAGVAIAEGRYDLADASGGETRHMWTSIVAVKTADGWKIAAIRNMLPAPPAK